MWSLRNKVISAIIFTSVISATLLVAYVIIQTQKIIEKEAYAKLINYVEKYATEFNSQLDEVEKNTKITAAYVSNEFDWKAFKSDPNYMTKIKKTISPTIQALAENALISKSVYMFFLPTLTNQPNDVWYSDLNKNSQVTRQEEFPLSYYTGDRTTLEWFYHPIDDNKPIWTAVYQGTVDADKDIQYTSFTAPVYADGQLIGVAGSDYYYDHMFKVISSIKLYETGYAFLTDPNFKIMIHPTLEKGTDLTQAFDGRFAKLFSETEAGISGISEYKWIDGKEKLLVYVKLQNGWYFAAAPYKNEVFADVNRLLQELQIILFIGLCLSIFIGFQLGSHLLSPVIHLTEVTHAIGLGDYEQSIESNYLNRTDEIGTLSTSIELMRQRQKDSFNEIQLQKKSLERRIIESEKIASLGYLVSGVAHEVNTPLGNSVTLSTYISEQTQRVKQQFENNDLSRGSFDRYLIEMESLQDEVFANLIAIKDVIQGFKELAAEKTQSANAVFSPLDYIQYTWDGLKPIISNRDIHFEVFCPDSVLIIGDPIKFSQIMFHVLSNALLHGFEDLQSGTIRLTVEPLNDIINFFIEDNGKGIEPVHLNNIFTPYFSTKFNTQNKGLGLNVVYNIVHKVFDGDLEVTSTLNVGTTVRITLKKNSLPNAY